MEGQVEFSMSQYLKDLRWYTLGMRWMVERHIINLSENVCLASSQARVQSNLRCCLWHGRAKEEAVEGTPLTEPIFHVYHDGKSFLLKIFGEFWGYGSGEYKGIDFNDDGIKQDVEKTLNNVRSAFKIFGVAANSGCNAGDHVGGGDIWWNVTIPFGSHDEIIGESFSVNLRESLVNLANAFNPLLNHCIPKKKSDTECDADDLTIKNELVGDSTNELNWLITFREETLGMSRMKDAWMGDPWVINLHKCFKNVSEQFCLISNEDDFDETLRTHLWSGECIEDSEAGECKHSGEFLTELKWKILRQDGRPFLLMSGEFRGVGPVPEEEEEYSGIDFSSNDLQPMLEEFSTWFQDDFLIGDKEFGKEFSHDSSHMWWSVKEPLDEYEFVASFPDILKQEGYCQDLRAEIINLAERLVRFLPYRIDKKTGKTVKEKEKKGEKLLQTALDYDFGKNGKAKDASKAVKYYKRCLKVIDSPLAHYNLALSYLNGDGIKEDKKTGYSHMWKASNIGYASASFYIGHCYENGEDADVDVMKAAELYRLAADKGHCKAAYRLGLLVKDGKDGVEKNPSEAFRLFGIAANSDDRSVKPEWLYEYARCFFEGLGTAKDPSAGFDLMKRAAESGYADAQLYLAWVFQNGWGVEKSESDYIGWLQKAADNGNINAEFEYGEWLADGLPETAIEYFRNAADQGHFGAQCRLEELKAALQEKKVAELTKKAERGDRVAQYKLGMKYLKGDGVAKNLNRGFDWLSAAADQGDMDALAEMGWCYLDGIGVPRQNPNRAFECFHEAAGQIKSCKNRLALKGLYHCYKNGEGTERNREMADKIKSRLEWVALFGKYGV